LAFLFAASCLDVGRSVENLTGTLVAMPPRERHTAGLLMARMLHQLEARVPRSAVEAAAAAAAAGATPPPHGKPRHGKPRPGTSDLSVGASQARDGEGGNASGLQVPWSSAHGASRPSVIHGRAPGQIQRSGVKFSRPRAFLYGSECDI
jgi:hypothetical protein